VTISPTLSATPSISPTASVSLTPALKLNGEGKSAILGPVPQKAGQPLCLWFDNVPHSSNVDLFNIAGERVASASFGANGLDACLSTSNLAPGMYIARITVDSFTRTQKVALVK
jgi:hypothetical protein